MPVLGPEELKGRDLDQRALEVFLKALEVVGGPRRLIQYRNLTWLPSLLEAAYAVVMQQEFMKTEDEIAQFLGVGRQTVRNILRADTDVVMKKLEGELREREVKVHVAGGLAKFALKEIRQAQKGEA